MSFIEYLKKVAVPILLHFIAMCLTLLSIWCFDLLLGYTLGENAVIFDKIPIKYLFHTADVAAILRFIWHIIKDFKNV